MFVVLVLPGAFDGNNVCVVFVGVGGLLFENCIVDASIFWKLLEIIFWFFVGFLDCKLSRLFDE